jgi:hypothetical protein
VGLPLHPLYLILILAMLVMVVVPVVFVVALTTRRSTPPPAAYGLRSPDGQWWWDGQRWLPVPPANGER